MKIFPILRQSLDSENLEVVNSSLLSISLLAESSPAVIEMHIDALVPLLLRLSTHEDADTRKIAIDCLAGFVTLPHHICFRHRDNIIRGLKDAIDDRKRQVRIAAAKCRNKWFVYQIIINNCFFINYLLVGTLLLQSNFKKRIWS